MKFPSSLSLFSLLLSTGTSVSAAGTGNLTEITTFGPNPTNTRFYLYTPTNLTNSRPKTKPAVLVVPHWCHGTALNVYDWTGWAAHADSHNYIVIYPDTPTTRTDQCWDVSSTASLTHNGGGDALGVVSMVRYVLDKYNADKDRVFVTGVSSGAMMTNVLVGSYPDVFAAGSAWAGVAFGCFKGGIQGEYAFWNDECARGKVIKSGREWAKMVFDAFPAYSKKEKEYRPKMQIAHGDRDDVLYPVNFEEEIKQWTTVFGLQGKKAKVSKDTPLKDWTRFDYGPRLDAYLAGNVTHDIKVQEGLVVDWFDLECTGKGSKCFSRKTKY